MKRRTIGPAYERCPAEKINESLNKNVLTMLSCFGGTVILWFIINFLVDNLAPTVYRGIDDDMEIPWNSSDPIFVAIKRVGMILLCWWIIRSRKTK